MSQGHTGVDSHRSILREFLEATGPTDTHTLMSPEGQEAGPLGVKGETVEETSSAL